MPPTLWWLALFVFNCLMTNYMKTKLVSLDEKILATGPGYQVWCIHYNNYIFLIQVIIIHLCGWNFPQEETPPIENMYRLFSNLITSRPSVWSICPFNFLGTSWRLPTLVYFSLKLYEKKDNTQLNFWYKQPTPKKTRTLCLAVLFSHV